MTLTDAEKTRLLAEGVMGWKYVATCGQPNSFPAFFIHTDSLFVWSDLGSTYRQWQPLTNEAHAAEVRERMRALRWLMTYRMMPTCDVIIFEHFRKNKQIVSVDVGCVPRGICHAALLALGLAKEEEL